MEVEWRRKEAGTRDGEAPKDQATLGRVVRPDSPPSSDHLQIPEAFSPLLFISIFYIIASILPI